MTVALKKKSLRPKGQDQRPWQDRLHRFTVDQYHQMIKAGVFARDERVELLEGLVVEKMSRNPPHDVCLVLARNLLHELLPKDWHVRVQSAITLKQSEPEPDLAVVSGDARRYLKSHPKPDDIALLVEVAESSLQEDRFVKKPIYARNQIAVYWIINLIERQVEVYTEPQGGRRAGFLQRKDYGEDEAVPLVIAGRTHARVPVRDLLP